MVQPFQITNVKAGSKYIIMYMYKTREYFTPFTFIWKKSVYWSSFAIWQEKSWANVTKQLGPCLITLHRHSSLQTEQTILFQHSAEERGCWQIFHRILLQLFRVCDIPSSFDKCGPNSQLLRKLYDERQITTSCWGNGGPSQISWLKE